MCELWTWLKTDCHSHFQFQSIRKHKMLSTVIKIIIFFCWNLWWLNNDMVTPAYSHILTLFLIPIFLAFTSLPCYLLLFCVFTVYSLTFQVFEVLFLLNIMQYVYVHVNKCILCTFSAGRLVLFCYWIQFCFRDEKTLTLIEWHFFFSFHIIAIAILVIISFEVHSLLYIYFEFIEC